MKTAIMGAGGVGGFYGGRMAQAGQDVTFLARGEHLEALRTDGLTIHSPTVGEIVLPQVTASDDPARVGIVDVLWITVKSYGLTAAARSIHPLVGPDTIVIPFLNGVDAVELIGAEIGPDHMAGGVVYVSAFIESPGVIRHVVADRLVIGEPGGGSSARLEAVEKELNAAGIAVEISDNIQRDMWAKYCGLGGIAAVSAAARADAGTLRGDPALYERCVAAMVEIQSLGLALSIEVPQQAIDNWLSLATTWPPETKPSMLLDLERGRPMELESLVGYAVRKGQELGVPTPVLSDCYTTLKPFADGQS